MHEGRISDRKMGRTCLFSQFFPFFIEFFEFCFVCCFFFCQFLAFNRICIDFFLHHQFIDFAITCFQNTDTFFCFLQVVLPFTETCLFCSCQLSLDSETCAGASSEAAVETAGVRRSFFSR